ncbi:transposase [Streptomyces lavendulae]|uniref:transposase n=1 Tax=Streptomyces lavendulae TaxID=1914 RepID=UPI0038080D33
MGRGRRPRGSVVALQLRGTARSALRSSHLTGRRRRERCRSGWGSAPRPSRCPGGESHLSDERWAPIEPVITSWTVQHPSVSGQEGRYEMREIVNALLFQSRTGCQWDRLPHGLAPAGRRRCPGRPRPGRACGRAPVRRSVPPTRAGSRPRRWGVRRLSGRQRPAGGAYGASRRASSGVRSGHRPGGGAG